MSSIWKSVGNRKKVQLRPRHESSFSVSPYCTPYFIANSSLRATLLLRCYFLSSRVCYLWRHDMRANFVFITKCLKAFHWAATVGDYWWQKIERKQEKFLQSHWIQSGWDWSVKPEQTTLLTIFFFYRAPNLLHHKSERSINDFPLAKRKKSIPGHHISTTNIMTLCNSIYKLTLDGWIQ